MQIFEADIFKIFRGRITPDLTARQGPPVLALCYGFRRFGLCYLSLQPPCLVLKNNLTGVGCLYRMRYGSYSKDVVWIVPGGLLGLIFAGYVLLASQKRYPHYSLFCGQI